MGLGTGEVVIIQRSHLPYARFVRQSVYPCLIGPTIFVCSCNNGTELLFQVVCQSR